MPIELTTYADDDYCYLTTTGRVTGRRHTIEIWFALDGATIYMLSGGGTGADWVKNAGRQPRVSVRLGDQDFPGHARVVEQPDEDARARELVVGKYQPRYEGDLDEWGRTSLVVAVDLTSS